MIALGESIRNARHRRREQLAGEVSGYDLVVQLMATLAVDSRHGARRRGRHRADHRVLSDGSVSP
jgi:hypothetical protein